MKRGFLYLILFVVLFSFSNCEKNTQQIFYDSKYKKELAIARKEASLYMMLNNIPGASFAIAKDGELIYSEGMGVASKDLEVKTTRKTKFRIGEVSEIFTSLIYQMMLENGTLHPDSTVQFYLPDYPESVYKESTTKITLNQLVNHSSGIRQTNENEQSWRGLNITLEKSLDNFKNDPLHFLPGWYQSQSPNNYSLLGTIMEKASGKNFQELLSTYITDTLQLTYTEVDNPFKTVIGRTDFYDLNLVAKVINATFRDMRYRGPSEGILSNAEDLVKLGNAVLYSDIISNKIKERIFIPTELLGEEESRIANGWIVQKNKNGEFYYGKLGSVTGGGAVLLIIPDLKFVLAATVNLTSDEEIPIFKLLQPFLTENNGDSK